MFHLGYDRGFVLGIHLEYPKNINLGSIRRTNCEVSRNQSLLHSHGNKNCKVMAFGQGSAVTGGYPSCPAMQCGATVTAGLTAITQPKWEQSWIFNQTHTSIQMVDGFPSLMSGSGLGTDLSQGSLEVETAPG